MHTFPQVAVRPARPALIKRHPLIAFFVLAYALSWAVEIPLLAVARGWIQSPLPLATHSSKDSVLMTVVWHTAFNFITAPERQR